MSTMVAREPFRIGRIFSLTFDIYGRHFVPVVGLCLLLVAGPEMLTWHLSGGPFAGILAPANESWMADTVALVSVFTLLIAWATLTSFTYRELSHQETAIDEAFKEGLSRLGPLIVAMILMYLGLALGLLLLFVPAFILAVMWSVTSEAVIIERAGILAAFGRSRFLTKGYRWHVCGFWLVYGALSFVGICIMYLGMYLLRETGDWPAIFFGGIAQALIFGLSPIAFTVLYAELRRLKEGSGAEELGQVFD